MGGDTGINTPFKGRLEVHHVYDISNKGTVSGASFVTKEDIAENCYDLITVMHVLEHVPYPNELLNNIVTYMDAHTKLYIEVPYETVFREAVSMKRSPYQLKRHWHEHINFFTKESIEQLIKSCGLKLIDFSVIPVSCGDQNAYVYSALCDRISSPPAP